MTKERRVTAIFFRRFAALFYDSLLIAAIIIVVTGIALIVNDGEQVGVAVLRVLYLISVYGFSVYFWCRSGQTPGLRAWRLKIVDHDGNPPTIRHASVRFLTGLLSLITFGAGFWWIIFDKRRLAWHDRLSKTYVVRSEDAAGSHDSA